MDPSILSLLEGLPPELLSRTLAAHLELVQIGLNLDDLLDRVAAIACELVAAEGCAVELVDGAELVYRSGSGILAHHVGLRLRAQASLSGLCVESGEILECRDTESDPRVDAEACRKVGIRAMFVVPLRHRGRIMGVLKVASRLPRSFDRTQRQVVSVLAVGASAALASSEELASIAKRLQANERRLLLTLQAARAGIFEIDVVDQSVQASAETLKIFGFRPEDGALGIPDFLDRVLPVDVPVVREAIARSAELGQPHVVEYRISPKRGRGSVRWIASRGEIIAADAVTGRPRKLSGVLLDVTEAKQAALEAQRLQAMAEVPAEQMRAVMSATQDIIAMKDRRGRMVYCNPVTLKLLRTTESEVYGKDDVEFLGPGNGGEHIRQTDERIMSSGTAENVEEKVTWSDGSTRIYLSQKIPWRDADGRVIGLIVVARDITERKRAEEQLRENERALQEAVQARDEFLSVASHELKTPITSLKLQAQLIQRQLRKDESELLRSGRLGQFVEQAEKQLNRLNRLIDDMLDVSRIRSGKLSLHLERCRLSEIVVGVVQRMEAIMASANTPLSLRIVRDLEGDWDRLRLEQVVTNLLTNALRYGESRPVEVQVNFEAGEAVIRVEDRGMGIAPEILPRLFERFERGVRFDRISGLGLGLYISRQIVELHGGTIEASSPGLGRGACFTVRLPTRAR
jgi:PAS domain S-box-containing protein